jgi:hypothetical protein
VGFLSVMIDLRGNQSMSNRLKKETRKQQPALNNKMKSSRFFLFLGVALEKTKPLK